MEKVKSDKLRVLITFFLIVLVIEALFLLFGKTFNIVNLYVAVLIIACAFVLFLYLEKRRQGIYFTKDQIIILGADKHTVEIAWSDLEVDSSLFKYWVIGLTSCKISSRIDPNISENFGFDWQDEKSKLELIKKFVPKDHELYKIASNYAGKRGFEF